MSSAIGLFGLGNMGDAIAGRLAPLGDLVAHDPDPDRAASASGRHGIDTTSDPTQVTAPIVVLSLPSPTVSAAVVRGLVERLEPGSVVVETSTVNPADARAMHADCANRGIGFVDAAILSGVAQMNQGTSTLLVGGSDTDVARARPVLDALAPSRRHLGPVGSGMAAKVINNAVAHAVMVVLVEAGAMAAANGVSGAELADLLAAPDAGLIRPLTHRFAQRILRSDYEGGMPTEAARKDSRLALELAQTSGVPLFAIQGAHTVYELARNAGLDRLDYSSIATLWEAWTDTALASPTAAFRPTAPTA